MNALRILGCWNVMQGKLKQKWAKLTEDDLVYDDGKQEELLGRIQQRSGVEHGPVANAVQCSCCQGAGADPSSEAGERPKDAATPPSA